MRRTPGVRGCPGAARGRRKLGGMSTRTQTPALPAAGSAVVQLGAFSSETAARAAWAEIGKGGALAGLSPRFEAVEVNGKRLTRLKVGPIPAQAAAGLCRAARVVDPWCRRGT